MCSASLAHPALKKELRAIKESRKATCLLLTQKLCSDRLCRDQNQVAFVLPTVICAEIANSPPSPTCHHKSSDSFICPPGILLVRFSPAPSPEAQQHHARTPRGGLSSKARSRFAFWCHGCSAQMSGLLVGHQGGQRGRSSAGGSERRAPAF